MNLYLFKTPDGRFIADGIDGDYCMDVGAVNPEVDYMSYQNLWTAPTEEHAKKILRWLKNDALDYQFSKKEEFTFNKLEVEYVLFSDKE